MWVGVGWGGSENRKGPPNTNGVGFPNKYMKVCKSAETRNLPKSVLASKVVNPFTCALEPPFYKETKELLHSEINLESREYSKCEHVHEHLLHAVICGTNFIIYKHATRSHLEPGLLAPLSFTTFTSSSED
jgi:hypothetical protein